MSASQWIKEDADLVANENIKALYEKYSKVPSDDVIEKTKAALEKKNHKVTVVENGAAALEAIKALIPEGASVHNTSSTTHAQIGLVDLLKENTKWNNLHAKVLAETDPAKQAELRRAANAAEYALSSVDAVTEEGDFLIVDASGTRLVVAHSAGTTIFVIGANKIVPDLAAAEERAKEYTFQLESARVRKVYGWPSSNISNKFVCYTHGLMPSKFHFVIIKESLGF